MEHVAETLSAKRKHIDAEDDLVDHLHDSEAYNLEKQAKTSEENFPRSGGPVQQTWREKLRQAAVRSMPLAERARPKTLDDFIGQKELVGPGGLLRALVLQDTVPSIILWGPCGVGKTTLARIIAQSTKAIFKEMGATTHGVTDVRCRVLTLNKLSHEDGMDMMIKRGARIKWNDILDLALSEMSEEDAEQFEKTVGKDEKLLNEWIDSKTEDGAIKWLIDLSDGDGRTALNTLEIALQALSSEILGLTNLVPTQEEMNGAHMKDSKALLERLHSCKLTASLVKAAFQKTHLQYDRQGEEHYNLISALHKSIRGSDVDASLYWLGRMLVAGEDPLYVARRLIRVASEDIGLADSAALPLATATYQACQMIGMPECDVNLAHCVAYMARAPKSIEVYHAYGLVKQTVQEEYAYPVPIHLRNAPTGLMKQLGYGEGYKYNPGYAPGTVVKQEYLPKGLERRKFIGQLEYMVLEEEESKGYQITQHYAPLSRNGFIKLTPLDGLDYSLDVGIEQLQLEQDTGKSLHDVYPGMTLIDLNRAGTGLMEIVTKPDMRSSKEAGILIKKLQALLRAVGSSDGNMDEIGQPYGARCELKNLNSIKFVSDAIDAEIARQIQSYEEGVPVVQETRGYDVSTGTTFRLRSKENAPDYRYMPEPDLPRLILSQETIDRIKATLPELPDAQRERLMTQYSLGLIECRTLMGEEGMVPFFEQVVAARKVKSAVSWTIHELLGRLNARGLSFGENTVTSTQLGSLIDCVDDGTISAKMGKQVLNLMIAGDARDAAAIIDEKGWKQLDSNEDLDKMCDEIMAKYPDKVKAIQNGNVGVVGFLMGQLMAQSKGRANPVTLNASLRAKLGLPATVNNAKGGKAPRDSSGGKGAKKAKD
ncbi:hypothetical protein BGZ73_002573 [Actinomortierella ambigua]|nr:hypothetical protein BGZ73_002573 [Actinomortierella ambigua]